MKTIGLATMLLPDEALPSLAVLLIMLTGLAGANPAAAQAAAAAAAAAAPKPPSSEDVIALIEKLGDLKAKGILSDEEFAAKKAELLAKL